jgi:hypothetical protein
MPLAEYLTRVSGREHRLWLAYLVLEREDECRNPTVTHWHLLALIAEVRSLLRKKRIEPKDCKLRFELPNQTAPPVDLETSLLHSKAAWGVPMRKMMGTG